MTKSKDSPQYIIDSYKRKQQVGPFVIGALAVLLVAVGLIFLVVWLTENRSVNIVLFKSKTPTPTLTYTATPVTPTATATLTATPSPIPSVTLTPTVSGPFEYTVEEGDNCWDIAEKFNVDMLVLLAMNNFGNGCPIQVGQKILIPAPDQLLPTNTPLPENLPRGTKITYTVQIGDTLDTIAAAHNSTVEDIMTRNKIEDANSIQAGQQLEVRVNLVTPTPSLPPTVTPALSNVTPQS